MTNKLHGGPAFPGTQYASGVSPSGHSQGMHMRDYFAAHALTGLLAHPASDSHNNAELVIQAYNLADDMLKQRAK